MGQNGAESISQDPDKGGSFGSRAASRGGSLAVYPFRLERDCRIVATKFIPPTQPRIQTRPSWKGISGPATPPFFHWNRLYDITPPREAWDIRFMRTLFPTFVLRLRTPPLLSLFLSFSLSLLRQRIELSDFFWKILRRYSFLFFLYRMSDPIVLYDYLKRYTRYPGRQRCFSYSTRFIYFLSDMYVRVALYM